MHLRAHRLALATLALAFVAVPADAATKRTLRIVVGEGGAVSKPSGRGGSCRSDCRVRGVPARVALEATPDSGFALDGWTGGCIGRAPTCVVAIDRRATVRVRFAPILNRLSLVVGGPGTIVSDPPGIACGTAAKTCSGSFRQGRTVRLTTVPDTGAVFDAWTGTPCAGTAQVTCEVPVTGDLDAQATFRLADPPQDSQPLSSTVTGPGSVVSSPPGIDCPGTCGAVFPAGARVILSGPPASWEGSCAGKGSACTVVVDAPTDVRVRTLEAPPGPTAGLNVTVSGPGVVRGREIACGYGIGSLLTCEGLFALNSTVQLRAVHRSRAVFTGWSGFCAGRKPRCTVRMTAAKTVLATFRRRRR